MKNFYSLIFTLAVACTMHASAEVPVLNSYAASPAVIFLDFDGQTVNGTSWNSDGPLTLASSNLNPSQIAEVFNRIAEDYRPFNINVTTDSTKYWSAPATQRVRMILTVSYEWYGAAGGVAFLNSFTWGDNTPAFVFTSLLGYNAKNIAEAASHEAGHTLGLRHQAAYENCIKTSEYNSGNGSGEIGWAPIMGVGYGRNLTQWNNGANPLGCTNIQDDLGIITSFSNGFGYRIDDHSNTVAAATPAFLSSNKFSIKGIIETSEDIDMINVNIPVKGKLSVSVQPFGVASGNNGSNLDLQLDLLNSLGTVIATYNPPSTLSVTFDTTLNAGTYFLKIRGAGNTYAPQYASLGSYSVEGSYAATSTLPLHKLELKGLSDKGNHNLTWEVIADENIVSQAVEVSNDASNFRPVASTGANQRTYSYSPATAGTFYYRLNLKFDDGRQYYSNTIVLKSEIKNSAPALVGNAIRSDARVNSPASFSYAIFDLNGRMLQKGNLSQGINTISMSNLFTGMYVIQYNNNGQVSSEKFLKQ